MRHIYASFGISSGFPSLVEVSKLWTPWWRMGTVLDPDRRLGLEIVRAAVIGTLAGAAGRSVTRGKATHYALPLSIIIPYPCVRCIDVASVGKFLDN